MKNRTTAFAGFIFFFLSLVLFSACIKYQNFPPPGISITDVNGNGPDSVGNFSVGSTISFTLSGTASAGIEEFVLLEIPYMGSGVSLGESNSRYGNPVDLPGLPEKGSLKNVTAHSFTINYTVKDTTSGSRIILNWAIIDRSGKVATDDFLINVN